jgi:glutamyl-tRNA reductase
MNIAVVGLSHKTAPVEVREKLAIPEVEWNDVASQLTDYNSVAE